MANRRFAPMRQKRSTVWEGGSFNISVVTSGSSFISLVSEAILEQIVNPTIVRIRGEVLVTLLSSAAVPSSTFVFLGIKLASQAAFGASAVEVPGTDIGSDWIWWKTVALVLLTGGTVASPNGDGRNSNVRFEIDSKAMRKVRSNEQLVLVAQNIASESTTTVGIDGGVRVLLKK